LQYVQHEHSALLQVLWTMFAQPGSPLWTLRLDVVVGEGVDAHPS
jgi:hypothetical protein